MSYVLTAEQSGDEQKTQNVYASKLDKVRESAASLTWRNIFGNTALHVICHTEAAQSTQ